MDRIELVIIAIANNQREGNGYVVVLREREGQRRLPVVIGAPEAQSIMKGGDDQEPHQPVAHDSLNDILHHCRIQLKEVYISALRQAVFFAELHFIEEEQLVVVDSRTSDALALAIRVGCPIYTSEDIMKEAGISWASNTSEDSPIHFSKLSFDELHFLLDEALDAEDFERATQIRDELRKREE